MLPGRIAGSAIGQLQFRRRLSLRLGLLALVRERTERRTLGGALRTVQIVQRNVDDLLAEQRFGAASGRNAHVLFRTVDALQIVPGGGRIAQAGNSNGRIIAEAPEDARRAALDRTGTAMD